MTLNKALKIFVVGWFGLLAILNVAIIAGTILSIPSYRDMPFTGILLALLILFFLNAVLGMPALAAEWWRSMRIAKTRFAILRRYERS
ncbi:MAG TPA: hypothetical protein VFW94_17275 [Candidatus Acidoferrales bacterium]|nr:hypothetical protein [Candidatus Acidoferrales bacterium]